MAAKVPRPRPKKPEASRPFMPGYGLPEGKKGLLPWSWAKQRLEKSHNYWITTVRPDGTPHTMVVWGLWLNGAFIFSTGAASRKARNLKENPRCVVCTERADEAVVVEGKARLERDPALLRSFFRRYEKKYSWDMSEMQGEPVFSVEPRVAFGLFEKKYMETATRWSFPDKTARNQPSRRDTAGART